tara:strand:+ start:274 stop:1038 length:765 start_codon:yes stop_codon:yes gene_type:complete
MAYSMGPGKIVEDGLVFYVDAANKESYPGSGTNINNLIDNNITGSMSGVTYSTSNVGVFNFDGTDDSVSLNSQFLSSFQNDIDASNAFSISLWLKTSNTSTDNLILFGNQENHWNQYETMWLYINEGYLYFSVMTDPDQAPHDYSRIKNNLDTNSINDNNWHHVCCTIGVNPSTTYLVSKVYIDGTLVKTVLATQQGSYRQEIDIINNNYYIGARGSNSIQGFDGEMSNLNLYTKELSAQEVLQNYNALKGRFV